MKHFNLILALILTMQTAFAGVITDDKLELGKPSSSSDKQLIFKGPTSKTLKSSSAGNLNYNGNGLTVGDGANTADKTITFNKGANSPSIKYNFATGTIQFSNDNVNFLDMGSGSGGAGGIQMLSDPEFEKATISTYWTPSAGTLTALTSGGNFSGFDKQSASWTPAAASNTLSSETITIVNGLLGARGSASIFYKTTSALHKLQVYDGSTVIAEKLLPANTGYKKEEFTFSIPTSGTIQLRILAGDTTPIYADKAFLGVPSSYPADEDFAVVENLFPNPKAEGSSPSWLAYKDAAAVVPVDGVNGAPTLSCTISSSAPLEKTKSFLITKPASNVQGEGCAHDLKVLSEPHKAKVLQVSFDYKIASGTYTDDTLKLYAYDIDNAQLFELAPTYIKNSSLTEPYRATFQTSLTGTKYRLIWHYAGTDAVATSIKIDNVRVSSQLIATGSFANDWQTFPCSGSWTTNTTYSCRQKITGDEVEIDAVISTSGAPTAGTFFLNLPLALDTSKLALQSRVSSASIIDGSNGYDGWVYFVSTSQIGVYVLNTGATYGTSTALVSDNNIFAFGASDAIRIRFKYPAAGKTSNTLLSNEYTARDVVAHIGNNVSQSITTGSDVRIQYSVATVDTHGVATTGASAKVTAPMPGCYDVDSLTTFTYASWAINDGFTVKIKKNGTTALATGIGIENANNFSKAAPLSGVICLNSGDYVETFINLSRAAGATTLNGDNAQNFLILKLRSNGVQVAASESIAARYVTTTGQSFATGAEIVTGFETKTFDNMNAASGSGTSWKWKCPRSGYPTVNASVSMTAGWNTGESLLVSLYKNGALWGSLARNYVTGTWTGILIANGSIKAQCNTGDDLEIRTYQDSGATASMGTDGRYNFVEFSY